MNNKFLSLALGLGAVCAFSGQANAGTFAEGALGNTGQALFNFTDPSGPVNDFVTFSVTNTTGDATVNASYLAQTGVVLSGMTLYKGTDLTNLGSDTWMATGTAQGAFSYQIGALYLGTGNYFLNITGNALPKGGSYNGNLTITPVPEPTEGVLLLSGIGLLGFIAARRRAYS